jgi:hypothetical protein
MAKEKSAQKISPAQQFRKQRGRPNKFETEEELFEAICDHFEDCEARKVQPTVNSLVLALGFTQRNALDYIAKRGDEFSNTISRAKLYIVRCWEENGAEARHSQFQQFILRKMKASGYEDQAIELGGDTITLRFGFGGGDPEPEAPELDAEAAGMEG